MKLYYTQPQNGEINAIYVSGGFCWDEWHEISELVFSTGMDATPSEALAHFLVWVSENGHAEDYFAEADEDYKYPESELLARHPDAVLFTLGQPVHLNIPTED